MNLEVANRLQQLRKAKGLSQEELANILGLSRQAISKWERAETSPDTDNLICLARLYNISIDKLLDTSESTEEIKERIAQERIDEISNKSDEETVEEINEFIDNDLSNEERIRKNIELSEEEQKLKKKAEERVGNIVGSLVALSVFAYIIIGFATKDWSWGWLLIFLTGACGYAMIRGLLIEHRFPVISFIFSLICLGVILRFATDDKYEEGVDAITYIMIATFFISIIVYMIAGLVFSYKNRLNVEIIDLKCKLNDQIKSNKELQEKNDKYKEKYGELE